MVIKQYINEDYFWEMYQSLDEDIQEEFKHLLFSIGCSADDYADMGKLSKITGHRVYEGCHRLYAEGKRPSEYQLEFWRKGYKIDFMRMDYFKTALRKFWIVSRKDNHKILKEKIKMWADIREKKMVRLEKEKQKGGLNSSHA